MKTSVKNATRYITDMDLSEVYRAPLKMDVDADASNAFDTAKEQAQVVGAGVFSFTRGVDAPVREAICDSALLAQLYANRQVKFTARPKDWFNTYVEVLGNLGWVIQGLGWVECKAANLQTEVNEKIIGLLTSALGAAPAAIELITQTIEALKTPGTPWVTIFSRDIEHVNTARFQIGLVSTGDDDDVFVDLVACIVSAQRTFTQALFFKWQEADATFQAGTQRVTINRSSLASVSQAIRSKIFDYQSTYLSTIKDLVK